LATRRRASRNSITGTITDLQRRVRHLQTLPAPSRLANEVVRRVNIQPRAVDSDQLALRAVVNDSIEDAAIKLRNMDTNSVNTPQIIDNAITRLKILDGEVVDGKLGGNSVNRENVKDSAINAAKLANASVEENKIVNGAVTNSKIGTGAVRTANIQSSAVTTGTIADLNVTNGKLATGAVTRTKLGTESVGTAQIENRAVTGNKIADGTITTGQINTLTQKFIVNNGVFAGQGLDKTSSSSSGTTLSVRFGTGSTNVPAGNHTHSLSTSFALSGLNRHQHSGSTGTPSTTAVKKDITTYNPKNIKNLLQLEPKQYKYKRPHRANQESTNREWMHGYLIEDLLALGFSEPVFYNAEGAPEALDYSLMSLLVLELVKTQQTEIESLKEEVLKLKDGR
jgi:hypothetical protein